MRYDDLPALTDHVDFAKILKNKKPAVFLDYDGTLTPIVPDPEDALLTEQTRRTLKRLSELCFVAIVSGRDRADVKKLVNLDELIYSGSHGFDMSGPGLQMQHEGGKACLPAFDEAERELKERLSSIPGAAVERKLFAIAIHYRHVSDDRIDELTRVADQVLTKHKCFKKAGGKKIIEFKPAIEWDKGKAVRWLLEKLHLDSSTHLPIYIGDDLTDEDAFRALNETGGLGILVGDHGEETTARYRLADPREASIFLESLIKFLDKQKR